MLLFSQVYLTAADGFRKFSPDGQLIWTLKKRRGETIHVVAFLLDGAMYTITRSGRVFAASMETGEEIWTARSARRNKRE